MKARSIFIASLALGGLAFLYAGVPGDQPLFPDEEPEVPIRKIHEETLQKFVAAQGFGYGRRIVIPKGPSNRNHQFTDFMTGDEEFRVALIGLVKNAEGTVYPAAADLKHEDPQKRLVRLLEAGQAGFEEARKDPPSKLDQRAITLFREGDEEAPLIGKVNGNWVGHGPIRATQDACIKCHEVERGALLGVFRYDFSASE